MASLKNTTITGTGYLTIPKGATFYRPGITVTTTSWASSTTTWTCPAGVYSVEVLVVAGGGGGGSYVGGGGGGGGVVYRHSFPVTPTTGYTVTVGAGGATNAAGSNSVFGSLTANGGGTGGNYADNAGGSGGSGGGAGGYQNVSPAGGAASQPSSGSGGFGCPGGSSINAAARPGTPTCGKGGGGAGAPGGSGEGQMTSIGGDGILSTISSNSYYYAGGGGGGGYYPGSYASYGGGGNGGKGGGGGGGAFQTGIAGVGGIGGTANGATASLAGQSPGGAGGVNTGGGGGGCGHADTGGAGGSGIVIIRYSVQADNTDPRGSIRYNTDLKGLEVYEGVYRGWCALDPMRNCCGMNLVTYSEQFDAAGWSKTDGGGGTITVSANATMAPDGTMTADYIYLATNAYGLVSQGNTTSAWGTGSLVSSIYAKAYTSSVFTFNTYYGGDSEVNVTFTLTGSGSTNSPSISSIQLIGNGWYRCSINTPARVNAGTTIGYRYWPAGRGTVTSGLGNYFWGAQLEAVAGNIPGPYTGTQAVAQTTGTTANGYRTHIYTSSGTFTPIVTGTIELLVVAGGGGGGMDMAGGGGGGGVISTTYQVIAGTTYTVTVGGGGTGAPAGNSGGQPANHQFTISATNGGNSVFGTLTAIGGGFGASSYWGYTPNYGKAGHGGSGGGASGYQDSGLFTYRGGSAVVGQGYGGGGGYVTYYSGGGGGAGGPGIDAPAQPNGGPGIYSAISGTGYYWGGGGGGAAYSLSTGGHGGIGGGGGGAVGTTTGGAGYNNGAAGGGGSPNSQTNTPGGAAGANTGGGGGGGSHYNLTNAGGAGGSGIVIIRYRYS